MFRPSSQASKAVSCMFFVVAQIMTLIKAAILKKYKKTLNRVRLLVIIFPLHAVTNMS